MNKIVKTMLLQALFFVAIHPRAICSDSAGSSMQKAVQEISLLLKKEYHIECASAEIETALKSVLIQHKAWHHQGNNNNQYDNESSNESSRELKELQLLNLREEIAYFKAMKIAGYSFVIVTGLLSLILLNCLANG
ncbi:hypothetical protein FJ364_05075 [Candidatus Dependentiae bacterium]|nr:hypothetical protein [Candidatus Dependentiae bacterium]